MPAVDIICPKCGRKLKLPDSSLLGRKGRCSKCRHGFIMEAAPPRIEFAEAPESKSEPEPVAAERRVEFTGVEEPIDPDETLLGVDARFLSEEPARVTPLAPVQTSSPAADHSPSSEFPSLAGALVDSPADDDSHDLARIRKRREQAKRKRLVAGGIALIVALAAGAGLSMSLSRSPAKLARQGELQAAKSRAERQDDEETPSMAGGKGGAGQSEQPADPIALNLVPEGARILIHLRPADLWQSAESMEEFRACLGPLGTWLETTIKDRCLMEPAVVEEALFALIPISRDTFDLAVVVRSKADIKRSDLIGKFDGELVDQPKPHYVGKERAWIIGDKRTFASAPKGMAQSLAESVETPSVTADGVQALLSMTDRKKHLTIVCNLEDVRLGVSTLVPENARKFLEGIVEFFGDDVDAVCWSLQLGDADGGTNVQSQVLVRNRTSRSPAKLQGDLKKKLAQLPTDVLEIARMARPKTIGHKKVVGRYPIMTKIVERSTRFETGHRLVSMTVELPERAGPNLALGTLLTWNQTTLPGFGSAPAAPPAVAAKTGLPDRIADRLKKNVTVEFRRDFLYKALEFLSEETGVTIKLDGPGMKEVSVTQNEYQSFAMENVPATAVLYKILVENTKSSDFPRGKLVLIVDEQQKTATITGVTMAQRKKLTPFPLDPASK